MGVGVTDRGVPRGEVAPAPGLEGTGRGRQGGRATVVPVCKQGWRPHATSTHGDGPPGCQRQAHAAHSTHHKRLVQLAGRRVDHRAHAERRGCVLGAKAQPRAGGCGGRQRAPAGRRRSHRELGKHCEARGRVEQAAAHGGGRGGAARAGLDVEEREGDVGEGLEAQGQGAASGGAGLGAAAARPGHPQLRSHVDALVLCSMEWMHAAPVRPAIPGAGNSAGREGQHEQEQEQPKRRSGGQQQVSRRCTHLVARS